MNWVSRLFHALTRRANTLTVLGIEMHEAGVHLLVLTGARQSPERVCICEYLHPPLGCVMNAEVLLPEKLGAWLRDWLNASVLLDELEAVYVGVQEHEVQQHQVRLAEGLSEEDVAFQLSVEVESLASPSNSPMNFDYITSSQAPNVFDVRMVSKALTDACESMANALGLPLLGLEALKEARQRTRTPSVLKSFTAENLMVGLQSEAAFGLALGAWHKPLFNFTPHRQRALQLQKRSGLSRLARCFLLAAFVMCVTAWGLSLWAQAKQNNLADGVSTAAYEKAQQTYLQMQSVEQGDEAQRKGLAKRQVLQAQTLAWNRVLSHDMTGVWVMRVQQREGHWSMQGEALSASHAHLVLRQLQDLSIWQQAPDFSQLQLAPNVSNTGVPVWQFRIEAQLKADI